MKDHNTMDDQSRVGDTALDAWLIQANDNLIASTDQTLDVERMLTATKRAAVANLPVARCQPRLVARDLARCAAGSTAGALALKYPLGSAPRDAKVLDFPGQEVTQRVKSPAADAPELREGLEHYVELATQGEPHAVERLLASVRPLVVRYCRARIGRQNYTFASADDIAQDVCLTVLTALPGYRDQGRPFLAFVYSIAAHKVAGVHRRAARNREYSVAEVPDEATAGEQPEQHALRQERSRLMSDLLAVLPDRQREIVVLRVVVGLSAEETAKAVGSTPRSVRIAQHRALASLRAALANCEELA